MAWGSMLPCRRPLPECVCVRVRMRMCVCVRVCVCVCECGDGRFNLCTLITVQQVCILPQSPVRLEVRLRGPASRPGMRFGVLKIGLF